MLQKVHLALPLGGFQGADYWIVKVAFSWKQLAILVSAEAFVFSTHVRCKKHKYYGFSRNVNKREKLFQEKSNFKIALDYIQEAQFTTLVKIEGVRSSILCLYIFVRNNGKERKNWKHISVSLNDDMFCSKWLKIRQKLIRHFMSSRVFSDSFYCKL